MWIIILIFFVLVFPSLCDADKKSCLSGIAGIIVIGAALYGLFILKTIWDFSTEIILYGIIALIIIAIIITAIRTSIDTTKRNKQQKLIKKILTNARCPYCQSNRVILPNYYGVIHNIDQQKLYCQDCGETWNYKEE